METTIHVNASWEKHLEMADGDVRAGATLMLAGILFENLPSLTDALNNIAKAIADK